MKFSTSNMDPTTCIIGYGKYQYKKTIATRPAGVREELEQQ